MSQKEKPIARITLVDVGKERVQLILDYPKKPNNLLTETMNRMACINGYLEELDRCSDLLSDALKRLPEGSGLARSIQQQIERNKELLK